MMESESIALPLGKGAIHYNYSIKKVLIKELNYHMVTGTGFGPVSACVKGMCVKPLHQPANNGGPGGT